MIHYRVVLGPHGRHFVLPTWLGIMSLAETYATREAAQEVADWLNQKAIDQENRSSQQVAPAAPDSQYAVSQSA
ncbi:MAG TPA: hypothetical protein EYH34_01835 [Planctomycetes bacterium]|nr:hypothetical protein [Planctomycetota bacterium]